jgi:vancomycin resistance protein YoaR
MNKILLGFLVTTATAGTGLSVVAARQVPTIRPNVFVGPVAVGGLEPDEAAKQLRGWWEGERVKKLKLVCSATKAVLPGMTPGQLGVTLDDAGIVAELPRAGVADSLSSQPDRLDVPLKYKANGASLVPLSQMLTAKIGPPRPAKVRWVGFVETTPETSVMRLDAKAVPDAVITALEGDHTVDLPLTDGVKHIPDEALSEIKEVVSEFTTHFPASNRPRCSNIKLAASKLNGVILMPGERLSFNGTVGRRTLRAGFKLAGVYKQGKHDVGVGGGICQVSTTMYNAALFANLKIVQRSNHSLPVAYVPLGRDATVDYGSLDLVFENTTKTPIGIVNTYEPGRLTFRVLGKKEPGLSVKVVQEGQSAWDGGEKTVFDPKLRPGTRRVIEPGSRGHAVRTYRLVYRNGQLVERQALGRSSYGGGARIVAVGPAYRPQPVAKPKAPVAAQPPVTSDAGAEVVPVQEAPAEP